MFIVNESYSGSGSWKTATCSRGWRIRETKTEVKREEDVGRVVWRARALAAPIYAPVTEPSGAIKLAL